LGWAPDGGILLTNLSELESAILAYKKDLELKKCARDFKSGGYNEGTYVTSERLVVIVLLIAIAYTNHTMQKKKFNKWESKNISVG